MDPSEKHLKFILSNSKIKRFSNKSFIECWLRTTRYVLILFYHYLFIYYRIWMTGRLIELNYWILLNVTVIDNLSIAFHAFARYILTSPSVDEMLLSRYVNWFTNFSRLPLRVEMVSFCVKYMCSVLSKFIYRPMPLATCYKLWFCLGWCICGRCSVVSVL